MWILEGVMMIIELTACPAHLKKLVISDARPLNAAETGEVKELTSPTPICATWLV
jgi:hypothetical protein